MFKSFIKWFTVIIMSLGTINIVAFGSEATTTQGSKELFIKQHFAKNTVNGITKAFELKGRKLTDTERKKIHDIAWATSEDIITIIKRSDNFEEYYIQLHDPEIRQLDKRAPEAKSLDELQDIAIEQLTLMEKKYPRLYSYVVNNKQLEECLLKMFWTISATLD